MARTTNGPKQATRGGQLLAKMADSEREIAELVGVSASLVDRWIGGQRKPTDEQAAQLWKAYGIPPKAWKEPPIPKPAAPKQGRPKAPPAALALAPSPDRADAGDDDEETNIARLHRFIREGLREIEQDAELSAAKKAEAVKKLADAQVSLAKSTGENSLTIQRILAHPQFKRAVQTITDAIAPYPEALASAIKAMETLIANAKR